MGVRILFDGPPGPEGGRFVEVEDHTGQSIGWGEWTEEGDYWVLNAPDGDEWTALRERVKEDNAVCICGCPHEDHESYGEDGECCFVLGHDCLRVSPAVAAAFANERERAEAAEAEKAEACALGKELGRRLGLAGDENALLAELDAEKDRAQKLRAVVEAYRGAQDSGGTTLGERLDAMEGGE